MLISMLLVAASDGRNLTLAGIYIRASWNESQDLSALYYYMEMLLFPRNKINFIGLAYIIIRVSAAAASFSSSSEAKKLLHK